MINCARPWGTSPSTKEARHTQALRRLHTQRETQQGREVSATVVHVTGPTIRSRGCPGLIRELTALDVLDIYKDQWIVEQRHRDLKQTLHVRPVFLHNDDRIHVLIAVVGIALLIYGLIEADLRAALGPDTALPGLLPEHRDAVPTARAVLAAFTDLHATYTSGGLVLDRLTGVQRLILAHLDIPLPWSGTHSTTTTFKKPDHNPQL